MLPVVADDCLDCGKLPDLFGGRSGSVLLQKELENGTAFAVGDVLDVDNECTQSDLFLPTD